MFKKFFFVMATTVIIFMSQNTIAQHSVAREWNEEILEAIRNDFARPTVHARNLFHSAIAMYDAWAIFDDTASTVLLGNTFQGVFTPYEPIPTPADPAAATHEIMSYAVYRLMLHRFEDSPGTEEIVTSINQRMISYGYNPFITSIDYSNGQYAQLGNYLASKIIEFGLQDGSNEANDYASFFYAPVNPPLILDEYDDLSNINPDRWQPLAFESFIDQSGNVIPGGIPNFLGPEWGGVAPFALDPEDLEILNNGFDSFVYNDPGAPPTIQDSPNNGIQDPYKWHFSLVTAWSSHLDPANELRIDISPGSLGNLDPADWPETFAEYQTFYDFEEGGALSNGHAVNPFTGMPYEEQLVKRSDYARVLAEFWADGPDSETPPGHWFVISNKVSDDPLLEKRFGGEGELLSDLEWDIKVYLTLGGAMHDAAVTTWGIKGYYDYVRPISALRYMAWKGQSSDPSLPSFDPHGLPLVDGFIEIIEPGDPLGADGNIGKVKIKAWRGPDFIEDPTTDIAGVDWILATRWWPYQRGTFVTPPFAGYVSGHSTFSRAAAEVLTFVTGDPFFPGGMGTFDVPQDDFLFFERGPSEAFTLQWATYRDASDQTSLSRIWGGIHPPIDDIPGRRLGVQIGEQAFDLALAYFEGEILGITENGVATTLTLYPNPASTVLHMQATAAVRLQNTAFFDMGGRQVLQKKLNSSKRAQVDISALSNGLYWVSVETSEGIFNQKIIVNR